MVDIFATGAIQVLNDAYVQASSGDVEAGTPGAVAIQGGGAVSLGNPWSQDSSGDVQDNSGGRPSGDIVDVAQDQTLSGGSSGTGSGDAFDPGGAGDIQSAAALQLLTNAYVQVGSGSVSAGPGSNGEWTGGGIVSTQGLDAVGDGFLETEPQPFVFDPITITEWHPVLTQADDPQRWVMVTHYDPSIEFPNNDRPWLLVHDGGGFFLNSGKISSDDTPLDYTFNADIDNIRVFRKLVQQGWVIIRAGYHVDFVSQSPGFGLFWKDLSFALEGSGTGTYFRMDEALAENQYDCAERDFIHQVQWIRSGGTNIPDLDLTPGRNGCWSKSAGGLLASPTCLGINRADPNAAPGSRYGIDTRMGFFINQSSTLNYNVYVPNQDIRHFPNAGGTGKAATLGDAKDPANTNAGPLALRMLSAAAFCEIDDSWRAELAGKPIWLGTQEPFALPNGPFDYDLAVEVSSTSHPPEGGSRVREIALQAESDLGIAPPTHRYFSLGVPQSQIEGFKNVFAEQQYLVATEGSTQGAVSPSTQSFQLEPAVATARAIGGVGLSAVQPAELFSNYERTYDTLRALVESVTFRPVSLNDGDLQLGSALEAVSPSTILLNDVGASWNPDRRWRRGYRLERSEQRFDLIIEFDTWVDLEPLDALFQKASSIIVPGDVGNGIDQRYLLVQNRNVQHPKTHQATSGTRAQYSLLSVPYLA